MKFVKSLYHYGDICRYYDRDKQLDKIAQRLFREGMIDPRERNDRHLYVFGSRAADIGFDL